MGVRPASSIVGKVQAEYGGGAVHACVYVYAHMHTYARMHSCMWSGLSYGCQKSTPGVISQRPPIMVFEAGSLTDLELSR